MRFGLFSENFTFDNLFITLIFDSAIWIERLKHCKDSKPVNPQSWIAIGVDWKTCCRSNITPRWKKNGH